MKLRELFTAAAFCGSVTLFCIYSSLMFTSCQAEPALNGIAVPEAHRKWTTVVYMAADNDLEGAAIRDFQEMAAAAGSLEQAGHTLLVILDRAAGYDTSAGNWDDTRVFRLTSSSQDDENIFSSMQIDCRSLGITAGRQTELNMAAPETLRTFLAFAQKEYPADDYALIIWGHGCGWRGYSIDEESDAVMPLPGIHEALSGLSKPLSVIAFDCCYGAMLETAYELRDDAEVLVAAERDEPAAGWNYTFFLENLLKDGQQDDLQSGSLPAGETAAERYAVAAVKAFGKQYATQENVSVAALSLAKTGEIAGAFDTFAQACAECITSRDSAIYFTTEILPTVTTFLTGEYPAWCFADIDSLAAEFAGKGIPSCEPALLQAASEAASDLRKALTDASIISFSGGTDPESGFSEKPMLAVYMYAIRQGGVVDPDYPQAYIRGSGVGGQTAFVKDSKGWVPQHLLSQSRSLLDRLFRLPLP